jgi:hypothetical protein
MAAQQSEPRSERVNLAVTPSELRSLQIIAAARPEDYDGASSVLRDYSVAGAVARAAELEQRLAEISQ